MIAEPVRRAASISLAPLEVEHVSNDYVGWLNDPLVTRYTEVAGAQTAASITEYVRKTVTAPDAAIWRILDDEDVHVGNIRLSNVRWKYLRAEVAILIGRRDRWGRGIAAAAIELLAEHAFGRLALHKLSAGMLAPNSASRRAFEKAGFALEATLRDHARLDDAFCDVFVLARLAGGRS